MVKIQIGEGWLERVAAFEPWQQDDERQKSCKNDGKLKGCFRTTSVMP